MLCNMWAHADLKLTSLCLPCLQSSSFVFKRNRRVWFPPRSTYCRKEGILRIMPLSSSAHLVVVKNEIDLTESEEKIFQRLLNVVKHYNLKTQLRVAGGWVRDKLLGRECYDIDIALDDMYGRQFCEKMKDYLGEEEAEGGYCVIQCNPEQSKHLETARMRVYDMVIDFVNLRSETYSEDSRIPVIEFGSPEEDALRRDLTINSLFYNINTRSIEDFTGRGIEDLRCGRIVTPLPAKETFLEDPLRVLRAIRFGARFDFMLNEELKGAASDTEVKAALKEKISRERIGHEIDLIIAGNHPVKAIGWIHEFQLFWGVFTLPDNMEPVITEGTDTTCVVYVSAAWNALQLIGQTMFSDEQQRLYLYGALFLPLRQFVYTDRKLKKFPVTNHIFRSSLKLKNSDAENVSSLHEASEGFISLFNFLESKGSDTAPVELDNEFLNLSLVARKRILAGLLLRKIKGLWRVALLISTLLYSQPDQGELESKVDMFKRLEKAIVELKLDGVWETKLLLDGNSIMSALEIKGKQIGEWQKKLLKWQLAHPEGTAEEGLDWIKRSQARHMNLN